MPTKTLDKPTTHLTAQARLTGMMAERASLEQQLEQARADAASAAQSLPLNQSALMSATSLVTQLSEAITAIDVAMPTVTEEAKSEEIKAAEEAHAKQIKEHEEIVKSCNAGIKRLAPKLAKAIEALNTIHGDVEALMDKSRISQRWLMAEQGGDLDDPRRWAHYMGTFPVSVSGKNTLEISENKTNA